MVLERVGAAALVVLGAVTGIAVLLSDADLECPRAAARNSNPMPYWNRWCISSPVAAVDGSRTWSVRTPTSARRSSDGRTDDTSQASCPIRARTSCGLDLLRDLGLDVHNLLSTLSAVGAFVLAGGVALVLPDLLLDLRPAGTVDVNPRNAGTLEWLLMDNCVVRSIPQVTEREPLDEHSSLRAQVDVGQHCLP